MDLESIFLIKTFLYSDLFLLILYLCSWKVSSFLLLDLTKSVNMFQGLELSYNSIDLHQNRMSLLLRNNLKQFFLAFHHYTKNSIKLYMAWSRDLLELRDQIWSIWRPIPASCKWFPLLIIFLEKRFMHIFCWWRTASESFCKIRSFTQWNFESDFWQLALIFKIEGLFASTLIRGFTKGWKEKIF